MEATKEIQRRAVQTFAAEAASLGLYSNEGDGIEVLLDAPHTLGTEGAKLSNYITGSFASFPDPAKLVKVGECVDEGCCVVNLEGQCTPLRSILSQSWKELGVEYTVVVSGSVT